MISAQLIADTWGRHPVRGVVAFILVGVAAFGNPDLIWAPGFILLMLAQPIWGPEPGLLFAIGALLAPFAFPPALVAFCCVAASRFWWVLVLVVGTPHAWAWYQGY